MPPFLRLVPLPRSLATNLPKPIAAWIGLTAELPGVVVKLPQALVMKGFELAGRYEELARTGADLVAGRNRASDDEPDDDLDGADEFVDYPPIEGWGSVPLRAVDGAPAADDVPTAREDLPIDDYDSLSAAALRSKVGALSAAQLASVRAYEAAHAKRRTVLQLLDRKIAAAR